MQFRQLGCFIWQGKYGSQFKLEISAGLASSDICLFIVCVKKLRSDAVLR